MKRTKSNSKKQVREMLERVQGGEVRLMWELTQHPKFTMLGFYVRGEIIPVQIFEDGSVFMFLPDKQSTWDGSEVALNKHFGLKSLSVS